MPQKTHHLYSNYGLQSWYGMPQRGLLEHRHQEIELNFVERGMITYLFGQQPMTLAEGCLVAFWAAIPHRLTAFDDTTQLHWLTFPLAWFVQWGLPEAFTERILHGMPITDAGNTLLDSALFDRWYADFRLPSAGREHIIALEVEARMRRLAGQAGKLPRVGSAAEQAEGAGFKKARQMAQFIAAHYTEMLGTPQIAQSVSLHPGYAMQVFRQHFHMSLLDYLTQYRIAHAQRLLFSTNLPIREIAYASGFGSESRFYAVFKRLCGLSPHRYRVTFEY